MRRDAVYQPKIQQLQARVRHLKYKIKHAAVVDKRWLEELKETEETMKNKKALVKTKAD